MRRGFTLVEILVVVAIVVVLAGILFPALASARKQAYGASDLSQMRQLAVAGTLYNNEFGSYPYRIDQLVQSKIVDKPICKLILDPFPQGLENYFLFHGHGLSELEKTHTTYPQSFLTLGDFGYAQGRREPSLQGRTNLGWAFTDIDLVPSANPPEFWGQTYKRVGNDGSVTTHPIPIHWELTQDNHPARAITYLDFFGDKQ